MSLAWVGHRILFLFAVLPLSWHVLGKAWAGYFYSVYVCGTPALLACLGQGLGSIFCRYLRYSRSLGMAVARLGEHILLLFVFLLITWQLLGQA